MKVRFLLAVCPFFLMGCGGAGLLNRNSKVDMTFTRTISATQNMLNFEVYVARNSVPFSLTNLESFASTTNSPSWADELRVSRSQSELNVTFTTRSDQPPYKVYVRTPGANSELLLLRIDVDGIPGLPKNYTVASGLAQVNGVTINRNSASY
jgi:hypothetical protein